MRALVWDGRELRLVPDVPDPALLPGTAVLAVRRAGICSTDLQILSGYMQFVGIPGHEFVGIVEEGPPEWQGRRVVADINFACGRCASCAGGLEHHCPARQVLGILGADGTFAERTRVPLANLHLVPDGLCDDEAAFAEPVAAALEAAEQTEAWCGARTLVLGSGKLGLLVAQALANRGDDVHVAWRNIRGQALARELGLAEVPVAAVTRGYDLVIDATGHAAGIDLAMRAVRPRGAIVVKTTVAERYDLDLAPLVIDEITLIGSRCGPMGSALKALASGAIRVRPLLDAVEPLSQGVAAMTRASRPGTLKIQIDPTR